MFLDEQLDRQAALKIPHFSDQDDRDVVDRFLREARAAANIHHPNLCPVYDVGEIDGVQYRQAALEVGEHELVVRGDDYQLYAKSFKIARGDNPPLRVALLPRDSTAAIVPADGSPPNSGPGFISDRLEHEAKLRFVDFSRDGRMLASTGENRYLRL